MYEEASQVSYQFDAELDNTKVTMGTLDNLGMLGRDYSFWSFWDTSSLVTNNKYPLLGEQSGLNLYVTKTGTDTVELEHGLDGSSCQSTISIQTDGTWNHVAVVYSASAQTSEFYVNGQLEDSTCSAFSPSDGTVEYGGGGGQGQWAGSLQQARLYTEAIGTEHLLNYTNWCLSYSCSAGYRRNSRRRRVVCATPTCSDAECCEAWPACSDADCTIDSKPLDRSSERLAHFLTLIRGRGFNIRSQTLSSFKLPTKVHIKEAQLLLSQLH